MSHSSYEVNFDGLVGPTHNYSGLSYGNIASLENQEAASNPKQAALQGLAKMKFLMDRGIKQAVVPPQERPHLATLRALGFTGTDKDILQQAYVQAPELLYACSSASSMWTANAATVSPSVDSLDGKMHITPANLSNKFHRSIEYQTTGKFFRTIFSDPNFFVHHPILPPGNAFADEGAANHTRFCKKHGESGMQMFIFGRYALSRTAKGHTKTYPARHTFEASQAIARLHQLDNKSAILLQQNPAAIDAGVFHNDVISVGNENLFLYHEEAFADSQEVVDEIQRKLAEKCQVALHRIMVPLKRVSLADAVRSYLFNSQIVTLSDGNMLMLAPTECQEVESVAGFLKELMQHKDHPIKQIEYFNLRESMRNGGGPACLRLRIVLNENELRAVHQGVFLTEKLYDQLTSWVERHYRDRLMPKDLADPSLLREGRVALDELTGILGLGALYEFQI